MAASKRVAGDTLTAAADLSAKQYTFQKMSGDAGCNVCSATTDKVIGVLQNKPTSGAEADVMMIGTSLVLVGTTLAAGDEVGTDTNGAGAPYVAGTDTTKYSVGICRVGAAAGAYAEVFIVCPTVARLA